MADVSAKNAVTNVTNDLKTRPVFEMTEGDLSGASQFLDVMMARIGGDDADLKDVLKKIVAQKEPEAARDIPAFKHAKNIRKKDAAEKPVAPEAVSEKDIIQERIKARIAEIASRDETPVKDDRAVKLLKKVAEFLLGAEEQGKIDLPDDLAVKLQAFIAQADNLKAGGLAEFMQEFSQLFRELNVVLQPNTAADAEFVWPKELADGFADLKLSGHVKEEQPVSLFQALKALKALVNASQNAALSTLQDKAKESLASQSEAEILIPKAITDKLVPVTAAADMQVVAAEVAKPVDVTAVHQAAAAAAAQPLAAEKVVLQARPVIKNELKAETPLLDLSGPKSDAVDADGEDSLLALAQNKAVDDLGNTKEARKDRVLSRDAADGKPSQQSQAAFFAAARAQTYGPVAPDSKHNAAPAAVQVDAGLAVSNLEGDAQPLAPTQAANAAKFAKALNSASAAQNAQQGSATQQVMVQIQNRANKSSQISIQLTPADLGKVEMRLNIQRDGSTHAVIVVDKPETLALLQKDAAQLEKALQGAGLNASADNMSFNLREQRQNSGGFGSRKRLDRTPDDVQTKDLALNVHSDGQIISDTRVNYHA